MGKKRSRIVTDAVNWAVFHVARRLRGQRAIAIHGLQRSGTNYLQQALQRMRVKPWNGVVEHERDDPRHKHFRWYGDKSAVPTFLRRRFSNTLVADDVTALNRVAGYPSDCVHIVTTKPMDQWITSACNWGIRIGWFDDREKETALAAVPELVRDYEAYVEFWRGLAQATPDRVVVFDHATLRDNFELLPQALDQMGVGYRRPKGFDGRIEHVPFSPKNRIHPVSIDEVRAVLREIAA